MNAGKSQGHTHPPRFGDEGGEGVHAGMMAKQGTHELGWVMGLQPGTAPGEQTVGSSVRLVEGVAGEAEEVLPEFLRLADAVAVSECGGDKLLSRT